MRRGGGRKTRKGKREERVEKRGRRSLATTPGKPPKFWHRVDLHRLRPTRERPRHARFLCTHLEVVRRELHGVQTEEVREEALEEAPVVENCFFFVRVRKKKTFAMPESDARSLSKSSTAQQAPLSSPSSERGSVESARERVSTGARRANGPGKMQTRKSDVVVVVVVAERKKKKGCLRQQHRFSFFR